MDDVCGSQSVGLCRRPSGDSPWLADAAAYPLAIPAAADGQRACRMCRPYRPAQVVAPSAAELVCQGVHLIVRGALDHQTEDVLAARLGVSGRHLRRLFLAHLGVTPNGFARACRADHARRLLADADLAITDIAFAAGYGSARQFNREFRRMFGRTPSDLRGDRWQPERLAPDGGLTLRLWFARPVDWAALVASLAADAVPGVEYIDGLTYRRTILVAADPGVLELGPGGANYLNLRLHLSYWEQLLHVAARARQIASLDAGWAEPARTQITGATIGPPLAAKLRVRSPGAWDPFEVGVAAIIRQQLPGGASKQVMQRLVAAFGQHVPRFAALGLCCIFPAPTALAAAEKDLEAVGLTREHASTVSAFATAVEQGLIAFDCSMAVDKLISAIKAISGIADRTAQYIAIRGQGQQD